MDLETIKDPGFLQSCSREEMEKLAEDIRHFLIQRLSVTGGHLGPNLGVVELTLILHSLYESPKDKIIWDVGHQAYVHKIVTGRAGQFDQLRKYQGLCGFLNGVRATTMYGKLATAQHLFLLRWGWHWLAT